MLIHPWDQAQNEDEWRTWIANSSKFGVMGIPNPKHGSAPMLIPTHFTLLENEILLHLARPNEALIWLEAVDEVAFSITGDYAFIHNQWRAKSETSIEDGVPTSYYVAIQFVCKPTVISDEPGIASVLRAQMTDLEPESGYSEIAPGQSPFGPMLKGIRAVRLEILSVEAKFKFDDHKPTEFRVNVAKNLEERNTYLDSQAATTQRSRLEAIGEWKNN